MDNNKHQLYKFFTQKLRVFEKDSLFQEVLKYMDLNLSTLENGVMGELPDLYNEIRKMILDLKTLIDTEIFDGLTLDDEHKEQERIDTNPKFLESYELARDKSNLINQKIYELNETVESIERWNLSPQDNETGHIPPKLIEIMKYKLNEIKEEYFALGKRSEYIRELIGVPESEPSLTTALNSLK